jgi:hypothetical protein
MGLQDKNHKALYKMLNYNGSPRILQKATRSSQNTRRHFLMGHEIEFGP